MTTQNKTTFVCFRWGTLYPEVSVERLYRSVKKHFPLPFDFHCFTDRPLEVDAAIQQHELPLGKPFFGNWNKERIFSRGFLGLAEGSFIICLDLDIVITGDLQFLVEQQPDEPLIMASSANPKREGGGHGSVIRTRSGELPFLWEDLLAADYESLKKEIGWEGEQSWIDRYFPPGKVQRFPATRIVSFKFQCQSKGSAPLGNKMARRGITTALWKKATLPEDARIVCFHGKPDLDDVAFGRYRNWCHAPFILKEIDKSHIIASSSLCRSGNSP